MNVLTNKPLSMLRGLHFALSTTLLVLSRHMPPDLNSLDQQVYLSLLININLSLFGPCSFL